jgi:hypothetical protein
MIPHANNVLTVKSAFAVKNSVVVEPKMNRVGPGPTGETKNPGNTVAFMNVAANLPGF